MLISCITRQSWFNLDTLNNKPKVGRGGGGIVTKYLNLRKCCPTMHFTGSYDDPLLRSVLLIEPLALYGNDPGTSESFDSKIKKLSETKSIKLLWCEEQEIFRWSAEMRETLIKKVDHILACNMYQQQLLKFLFPERSIKILYTPIDDQLYKPNRKKKQVIMVGKIGLQKNSEAAIKLFESLPDDVHTVFIGNAGLWGQYTYDYDIELENKLAQAVKEYIPSATQEQVAERMAESLVSLNASIYDVGSLAFLEAAMAGCFFFGWLYHPMFDEYKNIIRFDSIENVIPEILQCLETKTEPNMALREEVLQKHGFENFKAQLKQLIGDIVYEG